MHRTLKAVLYTVFNKTRSQVDSWEKCQKNIGPSKKFIEAVLAYDPLADRKQGKFKRVEKITKCFAAVLRLLYYIFSFLLLDTVVDLDRVKHISFPAFLLYDWVNNAFELRMSKLEELRAAKANNKEPEALFDEEELPPDDAAESGDEAEQAPPPPEDSSAAE